MYGKIENGAVTIWSGGTKEGFFPIVNSNQPQENPPSGSHYETYWEQTLDAIVQLWGIVEDQIDDSEALEILLGGAE